MAAFIFLVDYCPIIKIKLSQLGSVSSRFRNDYPCLISNNTSTLNSSHVRLKIRHKAHFSFKNLEIVENTSAQYTRQTKKMLGCLDRKEVRGAIWGVHSTMDRPAVETQDIFFWRLAGRSAPTSLANCPLDRMH